MQELIESEMQQLEEDNSPSREDFAEVHDSETKELNGKERSEVSINFGGEKNLDLDDNDENSLLSHQQMFLNPGQ